ncbi:hypothetical protein [Caulobacter sp. S45]|jgi:hypothetical protein|uniref:hypothetical protein n=1 Tax=Caulobacter sp. S45 TaxID=1641861 RepID=UPI00131D917E|nr:hypothetical protein [Caulobacter sp. S45]
MDCNCTDLAMLAVAHRTLLRTPECSRRLLEDYIDWLTERLIENTGVDGYDLAQSRIPRD